MVLCLPVMDFHFHVTNEQRLECTTFTQQMSQFKLLKNLKPVYDYSILTNL